MQSSSNEKPTDITWDLSCLFSSDTDPRIEKNLAETETQIKAFAAKWKGRDDFLSDPEALAEALAEYDEINKRWGVSGDVGYYFHLRYVVNSEDKALKARSLQVEEFARNLVNEISFFDLRLSKVAAEVQQTFLAHPKLQAYHHFLERQFSAAKYVLSEAEEKVMTLKATPAHHSWTEMVSGFVAKETRDGKNLSQLQADIISPVKTIRDTAQKNLTDIVTTHSEVAENELNAIMANKKIDDALRGFDRPDAARFLSDDIDPEVVDAMTEAVSRRFDISARYYQFRAKVLGFKKMKYYERNVPYGKVIKKYSYPESVKLVTEVFSSIDPQFAQILSTYSEKGQIDVYPRIGKRGGAFCTDDLIIHPTYIMLNHTNSLRDVTTLAHELGHGIQNELMRANVSALNFGVPMSVAEVASTFMEDFVLERLLKDAANPEEKLALLIQKLDDDMGSIFRQVAAFTFEQELHKTFREKGYLPREEIDSLFVKHMSSYMGPEVDMQGSTYSWVAWSHFRSFFYVYSYASGLLISKSLQASVKKDPAFIDSVKQILASGLSDSPKNLFKIHGGIDITDSEFWISGLKEVELLVHTAEKLWEEVK